MMDIQTREDTPKTALAGIAAQMRDTTLAAEKTRDDVRDMGTQVKQITEQVRAHDAKVADALAKAADALTAATTATERAASLDKLEIEVRKAYERMDAIEAATQRPTKGADSRSMADVVMGRSSDISSLMATADKRALVRMEVPNLQWRTMDLPRLGTTQFGALVETNRRPGIIELARDPVGLVDIIDVMPPVTGASVEAPRWTSKSDAGLVQTLVNGAITGLSVSPVSAVVVDSTAGMMAGAYVRFYTAGSRTLLGRRRILTVHSATELRFATNTIDFDIADNDECLCEAISATAEGVAKPPGYFDTQLLTLTLRVIASTTKISRQMLVSIPGLIGTLEGQLRRRFRETLELHLLYGTGTHPTINGFMNETGLVTDTWSSAVDVGDTEADLVGYSAMQIPGSRPLYAILNKVDWNSIVRRKASDGHYVNTAYGPMQITNTPGAKSVGPVTVIESMMMLEGSGLVLDPNASALYPQAGFGGLDIGFENDDFSRNLVSLRYEEALGHLVMDPTLFRAMTFDTAPASV